MKEMILNLMIKALVMLANNAELHKFLRGLVERTDNNYDNAGMEIAIFSMKKAAQVLEKR